MIADRVAGAMANEIPKPRFFDFRLRCGIDRVHRMTGADRGNGCFIRIPDGDPQLYLLVARPATEPGALVLDGEAIERGNHDIEQHIGMEVGRELKKWPLVRISAPTWSSSIKVAIFR